VVARPLSLEQTALVIGGGFFGARMALLLRRRGLGVTLAERESRLLARASLNNQARVHGGYHYPRSILTSLRSRRNYARFLAEYPDCVVESFPHYYAIARSPSKTTAAQFAEFCRRIGAPLEPAPKRVAALFDAARIEAVFTARECAFDAAALARRMSRELVDAGVAVRVGRDVRGDEPAARDASMILNCTYARVNHVLASFGASVIPMKHELAELALVEPPAELLGSAVTVMDGPFFSLMPYPARAGGLFTLSHVRYTPHCSWYDAPTAPLVDGAAYRACAVSRAAHMLRDAARYLPAMRGARYVDSLWEVKTVMPRSEQDDSRPMLLRQSTEVPRLLTVLGAKIDSVYDVEEALDAVLSGAAGAWVA
jgi:glycine/D-amino acid oxidase-like deaminating enzyme